MRFRNLALTAMASMALASGALAQPDKNYLPGCGPAQGVTFLAELAAWQNALAGAQASRRSLRTQLAALTDRYNGARCKPGSAGLCAELRADLAETRSDIQATSAFVTAMAAAVDAYRRQQPFVTPAGEACLRCKSPGDFNCANPGLMAGFPAPKMPMLGDPPGGGSSASSASGAPYGPGPASGGVRANLQPGAQPRPQPRMQQPAPAGAVQGSGALRAQQSLSPSAQAAKAPRRQGTCCSWYTSSDAKGCAIDLTSDQCEQKRLQDGPGRYGGVFVRDGSVCRVDRCVIQ